MHITLSPQRGLPGQPETAITVSGDVITVDGTPYDLSAVPEGGDATPQGEDHPFTGRITRIDGTIHAALRVVLGDDAEPVQPGDPAHWIIPEAGGDVTIPAIRKPQPEEADA
jgi:hypothetical protein